MPREASRVPDYLLERLAAGDLPVADAAALRERLAAEPGGAERLAALAADDAALLERHAPARVAAEVRRRVAPPQRRALAWRLVPALAVAAAVLVAVPVVRYLDGRTLVGNPAGDAERVKGLAPRLVLHRRTPAGAEVLGPGATARSGDLVQVGYVSAGAAYGVIVSIDGSGAITRHWPLAGDEAAALTPGHEVLLPESFRLDDAPGYERFLLVTAPHRFQVQPVVVAAQALAARPDAATASLSLDGGLAQASALLRKESR